VLWFSFGFAACLGLALPWAVRNGMLEGPQKVSGLGALVGWGLWLVSAGLAALLVFGSLPWFGQQSRAGIVEAFALLVGAALGLLLARSLVSRFAPLLNTVLARLGRSSAIERRHSDG
jgi:hypothetical protein